MKARTTVRSSESDKEMPPGTDTVVTPPAGDRTRLSGGVVFLPEQLPELRRKIRAQAARDSWVLPNSSGRLASWPRTSARPGRARRWRSR